MESLRCRGFHSGPLVAARVRSNLKLRAPIPPSIKNIEVRDDHPLWQFFSDKKYLRTPEELENVGEAWTVAQLRRKSFDDLHTLWYVCLKERNRLYRESRIYQAWPGEMKDDPFEKVSDKIKTTMWRIRHVLSERYHSHIRGTIELEENFDQIVGEFSHRYLTADAGQDSTMEAQLERFQYALFGINPLLEDNIPTPQIVNGLNIVSNLKLKRFNPVVEQDPLVVQDVNEAFIVFTSEHSPEGIKEAMDSIQEYRKTAQPIEEDEEYEILAKLIMNFEQERSKVNV